MANDVIVQEPEKIFLKCDIDLTKSPSEWQNILQPFYRLFESQIYEWDDFEFIAPQSMFDKFQLQRVDLGINDWLNMNECAQLARDKYGDRVMLNKDQFNDLRRLGEIHVKSIQFPGKDHVWKVNRFFQKGTDRTYKDFQKDLSRVLRLIEITLKNRVVGKKLSMLSSIRHLWKGIYLFFDLIFGLPHNNPGNIDDKMHEECTQFLICELNVSKKFLGELYGFWTYLEQLSCLPVQCNAEKLKEHFPVYGDIEAIPKGIYQFITPSRLLIDLRIMNRNLKAKCYDLVQDCINDVEQSNWFIEFKNSYVERVYHKSLSLETIEKNVLVEGMKVKASKIFELLKIKCEEASIPEHICYLMIENAKFYLICEEVRDKFKNIWIGFKNERFERIQTLNPYLSMISSWMRQQLKLALIEFLQTHQHTQLKMVIDKCTADSLKQHEYLMKRYLSFLKERKQLIYNELLTNSSFPDKIYKFRSKMVLPSFWKIRESMTETGKTCYEVDKYKTVHWSTRYPLWRWINYLIFTYTLMLTIGQFLLIKLPWKTRVSYLSLFRKTPFVTRFNFDSTTGIVSKSNTALPVPTLYSRLENLWKNVWISRSKFERAPFTGLLDKAVARHFHRIWVVGLKGGIGTVGIVLVMPLLCLLTSSFSLIFGALVPLWVPIISIFYFLVSVFIYDLYSPSRNKNKILCFFQATLWHGIWCGLLQLYLQLFVVVAILPFLIITGLMLTAIRYSIRSLWDMLIFHTILKRHAHIPAANDFMTKRISGPGLAYEYEILVQPEHVLTGLRCLMEKYELDLWLQQVTSIVQQPLRNYRSFVDKTLHPLNLTLNTCSKTITRLTDKERQILESVNREYHKRIKMLNISPFTGGKEKLRMSSKNLKVVIEKSERMWQQFYPCRILPRIQQLMIEEDSWWNEKNIRKHDMKNLSLSNISYLFGDQILSPIEQCDEVFQLEVNHLTMTTYVDMFITEEYRDDLDSINVISSNWDKGVSMEYCQFKLRDLHLPLLPVHCFFYGSNDKLPSLLKSYPDFCSNKKPRLNWIKKSYHWMKGKGKGYEEDLLDNEIASRGGFNEILNFVLYHPLIICALQHLRDRDNAMVQIDRPAVLQGIQNSMDRTYDAEFLESTDLVQSVDYSMNSLEDICNEGDISFSLLPESC